LVLIFLDPYGLEYNTAESRSYARNQRNELH